MIRKHYAVGEVLQDGLHPGQVGHLVLRFEDRAQLLLLASNVGHEDGEGKQLYHDSLGACGCTEIKNILLTNAEGDN